MIQSQKHDIFHWVYEFLLWNGSSSIFSLFTLKNFKSTELGSLFAIVEIIYRNTFQLKIKKKNKPKQNKTKQNKNKTKNLLYLIRSGNFEVGPIMR